MYAKGKNFQFVREFRGYTQIELCSKIQGLSQSNLSKFEAGYENVLSDEMIEKMMAFCNWPIEFLNSKMYRQQKPEFRHYDMKTNPTKHWT